MAVGLLGYVLISLRLIMVPVLGALLLSTVLVTPVDRLAAGGVEKLERWLADDPLGLPISVDLDDVLQRLKDSLAGLVGGTGAGARLFLQIIGGLALMAVLTFFFVVDGRRLWRWIVELCPDGRRGTLDEVGRCAYDDLGHLLRGMILVAIADAALIGSALLILEVPFAVPLALLTFLAAFIPILGATAVGALAVLVAVLLNGWLDGLILAVVIVVVQQLDGNVLQPFIVGRAVHIHPVVILLAVVIGGTLWGIAGALMALPLVSMAVPALRQLHGSTAAAEEEREEAPTLRERWQRLRGLAGRRPVRVLGGLAVSALFIGLLARNANLGEMRDAFLQVDVALVLLAPPLYFLSLYCRAWQWHYLLAPVERVAAWRLYTPSWSWATASTTSCRCGWATPPGPICSAATRMSPSTPASP